MLIENTIFGQRDKVQISVDRIYFAYQCSIARSLGPLYVCFSGGKDSTVLAELCRLAKEQYGVEYELHYNVTGIDPPELVYFMRENYRCISNGNVYAGTENNKTDLHFEMYDKSMWQLIVENHMPPTMTARYCCRVLKERGGEGRMCLTGVRRAESVKRSSRKEFEVITSNSKEKILFNDNDEGRFEFENCTLKRKLVTNPIIDWEDEDVWEFIKDREIPYCSLYDIGFKRVGCIGCPFAKNDSNDKHYARYPKFKSLYIKAFDNMLDKMPKKPPTWKTGQDVFDWWVTKGRTCKPLDGQLSIFDLL